MPTVGMLYPGHSAEDEYPYLESVLGPSVQLPVAHTSVGHPQETTSHEVSALLDLGKPQRLLGGAKELLEKHQPQAIMWACTSGSFVFGVAGSQQQAQELSQALDLPCSSTSLAFIAALQHLNLTTVSVSASYPAEVSAYFVELLHAHGITVPELINHDIPSGEDAGALGYDEVLSLATRAQSTETEAVLIPDTALHTVRWINELEQLLNKPVLTANQVTAWHGLQLAGHPVQTEQLGTLFYS